ncbi:MAG: hypothetical protein LBH68_08840, partial [Bifidobacteriaceae bacterium]|nr:hypothetical protein [Bifidobacteriaceae bacterium]
MVRSPLSNSRAPKSALGHLRAPQGRTGRLICLAAAATLAAAACTPGGASPMGGGSRSGDDPLVTKALPPDVPGLTSLADGAAIPPELIPGYLPPTDMGGGRFSRPLKDTNGTIEWWVTGQNDPSVEINWGDPAAYSDVPGVFTFRGANYRSSPAYGTPTVTQKQLQIEWTHPIGRVEAYDSIWPGAGWTGQPLLVNWPAATKQAMGFPDSLVAQDDFVEVIYPVFDGHVYRLDMATGQPTKPAMQGTCPFKGTGSVDPRGYPLLYAGQGLPDINGEDCPWRYRVFDLIQNRQVTTWNGSDPDAPRSGWGAFDSSALVDKTSGYLLETGENGLIYKVALAAQFDAAAGSVSVTPSFAKLAYKTSLSTRMGIESSPAAYRNLLFTQDNDGILAAWDAITLTNIWARAVGDDADATILVEPKIGEVGA